MSPKIMWRLWGSSGDRGNATTKIMDTVKTKIGRYHISAVLGQGGMGIVYKAEDTEIRRQVAIKMILGTMVGNPDLVSRFYDEVRVTANLNHPNIVTVYDWGKEDGNPYIVMAFLDGLSLDKIRIATVNTQLRLYQQLDVVIQVCAGLQYAHNHGVIHRDVKPANIVVLQDKTVKLVDFGIARLADSRTTRAAITRDGQVIGSLDYMSPEQLEGKPIDHRSDIYSSGVVLYQLLTETLPFHGVDTTSTITKILHSKPRPLSDYLSLYPSELDEILGRVLAKHRGERFQSADEFALELSSVQSKLKRSFATEYIKKAESCIERSDWATAKSHLVELLNIDRGHERANELLREIQQILRRDQRLAEARGLKGQAEQEVAQRHYEEALSLMEQAVRLDDTDLGLRMYRDQVREAKERHDKSGRALARAESLAEAEELEEALIAASEALALEPAQTKARDLHQLITRRIADRSRRHQLETLMQEIRKEITARRFASALELLKRASMIEPSPPEFEELKKLALDGREQERRRNEVQRISAEARELASLKQFSRALENLERAVHEFTNDPDLLRLREVIEGQRSAEEHRIRIASQLQSAYQIIGSGDHLSAVQFLEAAIAESPTDPGLKAALEQARALHALKQKEQEEEFERIREADAQRQKHEVELERRRLEAEVERKQREEQLERDRQEEELLRQRKAAALEKERKEAEARRIAQEAEVARLQREAQLERERRAAAVEREQKESEARKLELEELARKQQEAQLERDRQATQAEKEHQEAEARRLEQEELARKEREAQLERERQAAEQEKERKEAATRAEHGAQLERQRLEAELQRKQREGAAELRRQQEEEAKRKEAAELAAQEQRRKEREAEQKRIEDEKRQKQQEKKRQRELEQRNTHRRRVLERLDAIEKRYEKTQSSNQELRQEAEEFAAEVVDDPDVQQTLARIRRLDDLYQLPPSKIEQPLQATVIVNSPSAEQTTGEVVEGAAGATAPSRLEEESRTIAFPTVAERRAPEQRTAVAAKTLTISALVAVLIGGAFLLKRWLDHRPPPPPQQFLIKIDSTPPNARIHIKGLDLSCVTPCNDLRLPSGQYEIDATLDEYQPSTQPVHVTDQTAPVHFSLIPSVVPELRHPAVPLVSLVIQTHIADAIVFIDANQYKTGRDGTLAAQVPPNSTYTIRVQKDRYKSIEKSVRVGEKDIQVPLNLEALPEAAELEKQRQEAEAQRLEQQELARKQREEQLERERQAAEWKIVSDGKDRAGLQSFLERHPTGPHADEARLAIDNLDWESASASNNRSKLQDYMRLHPDGRFVQQCLSALGTLDWIDVKDSSDPGKLQDFVNLHPNSSFKAEAEKKLASLREKPPPPPHESDVRLIEKVLDAYVSAYQDKDKFGLRIVWPGLTDKKFDQIMEVFRDAEKIQMTRKDKSPPVIDGTGTAAQVTCDITTMVTRQGSKQTIPTKPTTFMLKKHNRTKDWYIADIK